MYSSRVRQPQARLGSNTVLTTVICFKNTPCRIQDSEVQVPSILPDDMVFRPDAHQSSNIRSDDKRFLSGLPFVSRSFKLFSIASVRTSQQHVCTCFSVRQVKGFPFQPQIWEDNCNRPMTWLFCPNAILGKASRAEDVELFGSQSTLSGCSDLITVSGRGPIQERI
jgi:hypothetical protein